MSGYAFYQLCIGILKIGYEKECLTYLSRVDYVDAQHCPTEFTDEVYRQISDYLEGKRLAFDVPYDLKGTSFQKKVWDELCRIPYGEVRTYKEVAIAIGNPKAYRAVGMANNKNPIGIIVPCHRVIGSNGKLIGYAGGMDMKAQLLEIESTKQIKNPT